MLGLLVRSLSKQSLTPVYRALALTAAAMVVFTALRGLASPWFWGHDGFNGAAFANAARNSLRFGILAQAQYHFGDARPSPSELYTHHPLLLHLHLLGVFRIAGASEWTARVVPAFYSLASAGLLFAFLRRQVGLAFASLALAFVAVSPLAMTFGNMVNHEQMGIFFCLATLMSYVRYRETPNQRWMAALLVAGTLACQTDWAGYYIFSFVGLDLLVKRRFRALALVSIVALTNLGAFFAWIISVVGSFDDMLLAFHQRSGGGSGWRTYFGQQQVWLRAIHGWLPPLVAVVGIGLSRLAPARTRGALFVATGMLYAGTIQFLLFRQAGSIHIYWTYYWVSAIAIFAAFCLQFLARKVRVPHIGELVLLAVVLALHLPRTLGTYLFFCKTAHILEEPPTSPHQEEETIWARHMGQFYQGQAVTFDKHMSIVEPQIQFEYYLNRLSRHVWTLEQPTPGHVLLVDAMHVHEEEEEALSSLKSSCFYRVWNNRYYAFDANESPGCAAYFSIQGTENPVSNWLAGWPVRSGVLWKQAETCQRSPRLEPPPPIQPHAPHMLE